MNNIECVRGYGSVLMMMMIMMSNDDGDDDNDDVTLFLLFCIFLKFAIVQRDAFALFVRVIARYKTSVLLLLLLLLLLILL